MTETRGGETELRAGRRHGDVGNVQGQKGETELRLRLVPVEHYGMRAAKYFDEVGTFAVVRYVYEIGCRITEVVLPLFRVRRS